MHFTRGLDACKNPHDSASALKQFALLSTLDVSDCRLSSARAFCTTCPPSLTFGSGVTRSRQPPASQREVGAIFRFVDPQTLSELQPVGDSKSSTLAPVKLVRAHG